MGRRAKHDQSPSPGFAEQGQAQLTGTPVASPKTGVAEVDAGLPGERRLLKLGPDGRVLIPADLRKAMRLRDGDMLVAVLGGDGTLGLWGTEVGLEKMRAVVAPYMPEGSVVDAFLADRRAQWDEDDGG